MSDDPEEKYFEKGDRVFWLTFDGRRNYGTVVEDTVPAPFGYTRVQYDNGVPGYPSASSTHGLYLDTKMKAEVVGKSYRVEVPDVLKLDNLEVLTDLWNERRRIS